MSTFADRIRAALDTEEQDARDIHRWDCDGLMGVGGQYGTCDCGEPDRQRRMVAAHRKILDEHPARERRESWDEYRTICATCTYDSGTDVHEYPCPTVLALAEAYVVEA